MLSFGAVSSGIDYVYWKVAVVLGHGAGFVLENEIGLYRNYGLCSGDLETCFEDWIGATCLEAWIGG